MIVILATIILTTKEIVRKNSKKIANQLIITVPIIIQRVFTNLF